VTWAEWLFAACVVVCLLAVPVLRRIDRANKVIDGVEFKRVKR
jgi:hypothetical protein